MKKKKKKVKVFFILIAIIFFLLAIVGFIFPILPGTTFLIFALIFMSFGLGNNIFKKLKKMNFPGTKFLFKIRKKILKEEFQIKLFTFLTIKFLIIFLVLAILIGNYEFVYYDSILIPLVLLIYYLHKQIRLHLPVFILVCLIFLMHAAGGILHFNNVRLYDIAFWIFKYDNFVHFIGSIVIVLILYNLIFDYISDDKKRSTFYLFIILTLMAAGVGTLIELIEFLAVIFFNAGEGVGDYFNNLLDLAYNLFGAIFASYIVVIYHKSKIFKNILEGKMAKLGFK